MTDERGLAILKHAALIPMFYNFSPVIVKKLHSPFLLKLYLDVLQTIVSGRGVFLSNDSSPRIS